MYEANNKLSTTILINIMKKPIINLLNKPMQY